MSLKFLAGSCTLPARNKNCLNEFWCDFRKIYLASKEVEKKRKLHNDSCTTGRFFCVTKAFLFCFQNQQPLFPLFCSDDFPSGAKCSLWNLPLAYRKTEWKKGLVQMSKVILTLLAESFSVLLFPCLMSWIWQDADKIYISLFMLIMNANPDLKICSSRLSQSWPATIIFWTQ